MAKEPESSPAPDATNRRRSGRVVSKPVLYQEDPDISTTTNGSTKRKRAQSGGEDDEQDDASDSSAEESEDDRPKKGKGKARKPANKKPRSSQGAKKLAIRPAVNGARKPAGAKKGRASDAEVDDGSLYSKVFQSSASTREVAEKWIQDYNDDGSEAMCKFVNFVLRCTGCTLEIDTHDVQDADNAPSKLSDLQDEYQQKRITEYPLIHKGKGQAFSRRLLEEFIHDLIEVCDEAGILHEDEALWCNMEVWIATMTQSQIRPFRHTATVIALTLTSALSEVMKRLNKNNEDTTRLQQQEEKKKSKSKDKLSTYGSKIKELQVRKKTVAEWIRGVFDSTYIHRYRDIDPKVRADCAAALGSWMHTCPDIFFESEKLRYLGWLLADQNNTVRHQVLEQLQRLYDANESEVGRFRAFTHRFRERLVEIATRDTDISIRIVTINLLHTIRDMGLLEAEQIDTIGQLVFDAEPRVRKAIAPFLAASVEESYGNISEALGGDEGLEEILGQETENDYESPHSSWLKYKSIAQLLDEYDTDDGESAETQSPELQTPWSTTTISRYTTAAQVVYEGVKEVKEAWPALAGYLLYDATTKQTNKKRKSQDPLQLFKQRCNLTDKQERLLLEVLVTAVETQQAEASAIQTDKKSRKKKVYGSDEIAKAQENAQNVVAFLPRLLAKYGANPATAVVVLRMAQKVPFDELAEDSTEYESLLNDLEKQYLTHDNGAVLEQAKCAFLHASKFEELEETTSLKIDELWDKISASLRQNVRTKTPQLDTIAGNILRLLKLSDISDPTSVFTRASGQKTKGGSTSLLEIFIGLIETYAMTEDEDAEAVATRSAAAVAKFYMWSVTSILKKAASSSDVEATQIPHRQQFTVALTSFINERQKTNKARIAAVCILLDSHSVFASLRQLETDQSEGSGSAQDLIETIPTDAQNLILSSFLGLEKQYAKKAGKSLQDPAEDEVSALPESDDEQDDEDVDEETQTQQEQQREQERLLIEKSLCELASKMVLAILAGVLDAAGPEKGTIRKRMSRNKAKLGQNFKEVVSFLDGPKSKTTKVKSKATVQQRTTSAPVVTTEDEEEEDEIEDVEDGDIEDLRRKELLTDAEDDIEDDGPEAEGNDNDHDDDDIMGD